MVQAYNDDSIVSMQGLEPVRTRPTAFINSLDASGQVHIVKELLDNSYDELNNVHYQGVINIYLFTANDTYQVLVTDNGRGIPLGKFKSAISQLWTSGKVNSDAYTTSSGTYGLGAKCQAALSRISRAITFRKEGIGILHLADGKIEAEDTLPNLTATAGTYIFYELNKSWESHGNIHQFLDIENFTTVGYLELLKIIRVNDIFNTTIQTRLHIVDTPIPNSIWNTKSDVTHFLSWIDSLSNNSTPVYDTLSLSPADRAKYTLEYFDVDSPVLWSCSELEYPLTHGEPLAYNLKMFYVRSRKSGNLTLINSVLMQIESNSANVSIQDALYPTLAKYIEDMELRKFFLHRNYKLPLLISSSIRYAGAQFAGTNKLDFKDKNFAKLFTKSLLSVIEHIDPNYWQQLVALFLPDLENKYALYHCKPIVAKDTKKLLLELINPGNYTACKTTDRSKAELFIVEGTSAGHLKKVIDSEYQAIFETRGKPLNAISVSVNKTAAFDKLKKNEIFSDLIKILNVTPFTKDMTECNFGKIIIATDADADGEHIVSLYLSNFHLLNPNLISTGMIHVATPPLYIMNLQNKKIHLRDKYALFDARISLLYSNIFDIEITTLAQPTPLKLEGDMYREFCYAILELGEAYTNVSNLLNIPLLVLERLAYGIEYLYPTVNMTKLMELFPTSDSNHIRLNYHDKTQILVLSIDDKDIPISITSAGETIKSMLLPKLIPLKYKHWDIRLTTKLTDTHSSSACTPMQVYTAMCSVNDLKIIRMDRYKGLGEMNKEDMRITISDPSTRKLYQVTSIGDAESIAALMGKDSLTRKKLLMNCGSISFDMSCALNNH